VTRISLARFIPFVAVCLVTCQPPRGWTESVTGMEFVWISPGRFQMGSSPAEPADVRPAPIHNVEITRGFYLARYEVTQAQWQRVMGVNPSQFQQCGPRCPIETVTWYEVQDFLRQLSEITNAGPFRLPTEAEWEYACRAGTETPFSTGETLTTTQANFDGRMAYLEGSEGTFRGTPTPVGSFLPNPWGLYDMHGNVWEWTSDEYCPYATETVQDPIGRCASGLKNIRGGSWYFSASSARCGRRYTHAPSDRGFSIGFRVVMDRP